VKPLDEQTHYEILEIELEASREDVDRAYRMARTTYAPDSMATYSILSEEDVRVARERVELSYEVLSDPVARQRYDAGLKHEADEAGEAEPDQAPEFLLLPPTPEPEGAPVPVRAEMPPEIEGFEDVDDEGEAGVYDGARLRRARLRRGIEIEQIASITKVSPAYLRFIEEERFDELPASVYVRGFVSAYARCLGLDAAPVALSYMVRMQHKRGDRQSSRGWGRG
jgi:flagellar biosynthesis protein FlhG